MHYPGPKFIKENIFGCGNSGLERPYKKVLFGEESFESIIKHASTSNQDDLIEDLLLLLKSKERYTFVVIFDLELLDHKFNFWLKSRHLPDKELEKRAPQAVNELSSIFVHREKARFGTRTHTIVLVDDMNNFTFVEETMLQNGKWKRQLINNTLE